MNLSNKKMWCGKGYFYPEYNIKQFIKELKEEINKFAIHRTGVHKGFLCKKINELAGEELI